MDTTKLLKQSKSHFDLERFNNKKIQLNEPIVEMKTTEYDTPVIENDRLIDKNGNQVGTKGDMYFKLILHTVFQEGCLDNDPRPRYIDKYQGATYHEEIEEKVVR